MFGPSAMPAKAGGHRPVFRVCYLCGQQFGTASIGIHIPQCYQKKLSQWEKNDPLTRGPKPKTPESVNWKGGTGVPVEKINEAQYETFNSQLVPCPNCARTFLPDRLPVHLRGCKGGGNGAAGSASARTRGTRGAGAVVAATASARPSSKSNGRSSVSSARSTSVGPRLLPTCYLCGQQFGTASIGIHVPQCYEKKLAQWKVADPRVRGQPPKHPDTVSWKGRHGATAQEQAEEQFQEFMNQLDPCPNCGRKFLPDRLVVHLRSCRPGNAAKPLRTRLSGALEETAPASGATANKKEESSGAERRPLSPSSAVSSGEDRHDPKRNRLPRNLPAPMEGRTCAQCGVVEYSAEAKFCRECGVHFDVRHRPQSCQHCGERIPHGSRFCGTCGQPVDGASAYERAAGDTTASSPTARVVVCPACRVVCDADGNFCDNCGAALGDADLAPAAAAGKDTAEPAATSKMCPTCHLTVPDAEAVFCEDCGTRLEVPMPPPDNVHSTLPPDEVVRLSASKEPTATSAIVTATAPLPSKAPVLAVPVAKANPQRAVALTAFAAEAGDAEGEVERHPCSHCGRRFAPEALERHERVCAARKTRRLFNAAKQRQSEDASSVSAPTATVKKATAAVPAAPKHDWKAESEAFRRALREARHVDQVLKSGGTTKNLPPPTYSVNPDYIQCPHCHRRFAPDVAQRHIPKCATTLNRPKPPPRRR